MCLFVPKSLRMGIYRRNVYRGTSLLSIFNDFGVYIGVYESVRKGILGLQKRQGISSLAVCLVVC